MLKPSDPLRLFTVVLPFSVLANLAPSVVLSAAAQTPAPFVVAEFAPPVSNQFGLAGISNGPSRAVQTFTVTRDGKLNSIQLLLSENGPVPNSVVIELRPVDPGSGAPTSEILASAAANTSALSSTRAYFTANFASANIALRAGTVYAFSFRTDATGTGAYVYGDLQSISDPYAGGAYYRSSDGSTWSLTGPGNYDFAFRVTAIPAVVVSADNTFGAGKLSEDLITGMEWLDLTLTQGKSPQQILDGYGGYIAAGFRFATATEVQALWEHFGMTQVGAATAAARDVAAAQQIIDTMGITSSGSGFSSNGGYALVAPSSTSYTQSSVEAFTTSSFCSQFGLSTPCARALGVNGTWPSSTTAMWVGAMLVRDPGPLDQSFYPFNFIGGDISVNGYSIGGGLSQNLAQTFTVGVTGSLTRVDLQVGGFGNPTLPVQLDIRPTVAGVPDANATSALTSAVIPVSGILAANPTNAFVTVYLNPAIQVTAGTVLAVVLTSNEQIGSYGWLGSTSFSNPAPPLYTRGGGFFRNTDNPSWRNSGTTDHGFRTYVDTNTTADTTAPEITVPSDIHVEATSGSGAVVTYVASATDNADPSPHVVCAPLSGATFPLGPTVVSCTATDSSGNSSNGTFTVMVVDTTTPVMSNVPANIPREATGPNGAAATWTSPTALDTVDGAVSVACLPQTGSVFALGPTTVTCSAADHSGNSTSATFTVMVRDTTAPLVQISSPGPDAVIAASPSTVTVQASDLVGVTALTVNGVAAARTSGSAQSGTWQAQVPVNLAGVALSFTALAQDASSNSATTSLGVDNDGIASVIDRTTAGVDQSTVYSSQFTDGTTFGTITRSAPNTMVIADKLPTGGVRLAVLGSSSVYADVYLCSGNTKYVHLNGGESADVTCAPSGTVTVKVSPTSSTVEIYKQAWSTYYTTYTYYVTQYYSCGYRGRGTCWYSYPVTRTYWTTYTYWYWISLAAGQSASTGSPVIASDENIDPIQVILLQVQDDGTQAPVGSFFLDPGESADVDITGGSDGRDDVIGVSALIGDVESNIGGETRIVAHGTRQQLMIDLIPPTVVLSSLDPNPTGTSPIHVTVTSSEPLVGFTAGSLTASNAVISAFQGDGASYSFDLIPSTFGVVAVTIPAGAASDASGNVSGAPSTFTTAFVQKQGQTINFDPLPDVAYGTPSIPASATATSGLPVTFGATGSCSVAGTTVTINAVGGCTVTASQGGNALYLAATSVSRTFQVVHSWSRLLQPVNLDGSSIFKLGSTVPVKFKLTGGSSSIVNLGARIYIAKISNSVAGTELEATATNSPDAGDVFRYDSSSGQYIFNWGTKGLTEGAWQIRVDLLDGAPAADRTVTVSLRK
jgi:HYR domain-containing protein